MRVLRSSLIIVTGALLILVGGGIWGCTLSKKPSVHPDETGPRQVELLAWKEGVKAFNSGDYGMAESLFESLSHTAEDETLRRRALYAVACTKFILAQDGDKLSEAMAHWDMWSGLAPLVVDHEDPRMLGPVLERIVSQGTHPTSKNGTNGSDTIQACRKLVRQKEKEIKQLKHQLEALEAIHREIEEKKKGVSSP